jgi:hypothetical protein
MKFSGNFERSAAIVSGTPAAVATCTACAMVSGGAESSSPSAQTVGSSGRDNSGRGA